jgi:hypothetical protein
MSRQQGVPGDKALRDEHGRHVSPDSQLEGTKFGKAESAEPSLDTEHRGEAREEDVATTGSSAGVEGDAHRASTHASETTMMSVDGQGTAALRRSASRQQIDRLLNEAMSNFHATGPLVNPLERTPSSSSMDMRIRFVCEAKGFDYGIFWAYDDDKKSLTCSSKTCLSAEAMGVKLFVETSSTMFARYSMGFGMPGRIGYTGNYEWHEDIRQLPAWSFQRKRQAEQANLRTVIGVPLDHGVVEFGTRFIADHNVATVQYIQKLCQVSQPL